MVFLTLFVDWLFAASARASLLTAAVFIIQSLLRYRVPVRELQFVLRHELTHIKRGDLPLNALLCVLLSLHWFNPLLWFAFFKARLDRESLRRRSAPTGTAAGAYHLRTHSAEGGERLRL